MRSPTLDIVDSNSPRLIIVNVGNKKEFELWPQFVLLLREPVIVNLEITLKPVIVPIAVTVLLLFLLQVLATVIVQHLHELLEVRVILLFCILLFRHFLDNLLNL